MQRNIPDDGTVHPAVCLSISQCPHSFWHFPTCWRVRIFRSLRHRFQMILNRSQGLHWKGLALCFCLHCCSESIQRSHTYFAVSHQMSTISAFIPYTIQRVIDFHSVHFTMNLSASLFSVSAFGFLASRNTESIIPFVSCFLPRI
jgi:hypothetical protein